MGSSGILLIFCEEDWIAGHVASECWTCVRNSLQTFRSPVPPIFYSTLYAGVVSLTNLNPLKKHPESTCVLQLMIYYLNVIDHNCQCIHHST